MSSEVVASIRFRKWRRRHDWECLECGVPVRTPLKHARFHAALLGLGPFRPNELSMYEGVVPIEMAVHLDAQGQQI